MQHLKKTYIIFFGASKNNFLFYFSVFTNLQAYVLGGDTNIWLKISFPEDVLITMVTTRIPNCHVQLSGDKINPRVVALTHALLLRAFILFYSSPLFCFLISLFSYVSDYRPRGGF